MRSSFWILLAAFGWIGPASLADDLPKNVSIAPELADSDSTQQHWDNTLTLGLNVYHIDYAEKVDVPLKSTESGLLPGFEAAYQVEPRTRDFFFKAVLDATVGATRYDGTTQLQDGAQPVQGWTPAYFVNSEVDMGFALFRARFSDLKLYAGLGYHEWQRGNGDAGDIPENYSWFYAPVGFRYELQVNDRFEWDLDASADFMFGGKINVQLSKISDNPDVAAPLASRIGYRIQSPFSLRVSSGLRLLASPWLQYSAIGGSPQFPFPDLHGGGGQVSALEPPSTTYEVGSTLGIIVDL